MTKRKAKDFKVINRVISAEEYLKAMLGKDIKLTAENQYEEVISHLEDADKGVTNDYPISEISEIIEAETTVVLVHFNTITFDNPVKRDMWRWMELDADGDSDAVDALRATE